MYRRFSATLNRLLAFLGTRKTAHGKTVSSEKREIVKAAFTQGSKSIFGYCMSVYGDWGFKLSNVQKKVGIWYGSNDAQVLPETAVLLSTTLQTAELHRCEGENHTSLLPNRIGEILTSLLPT